MSHARLAHLFLWRKGFVLATCGMGWDGYCSQCSLALCPALEWPVLPWMHSDVMWLQEPLRHLAEVVLPIGNHSCIPNAETSFPENNFLLHLTALEDIEAGEVRQQGLR